MLIGKPTSLVIAVSAAMGVYLFMKRSKRQAVAISSKAASLQFFVLGEKFYQKLGEAWDHSIKDFVVLYRPMYHCLSKKGSFEAHVLAVRNFDEWCSKFKPCSFEDLSSEATDFILYQPCCWFDPEWVFNHETKPVLHSKSGLVHIRTHESMEYDEKAEISENVIVASKGVHKLNALNDAFKTIKYKINSKIDVSDSLRNLVNYIDHIHAESSPSSINEQPWGFEETLIGAKNRLEHIKNTFPNKLLYCAIENGLVEIGGHFYDFAWVIIEMRSTANENCYHRSETMSAMVKFPHLECEHVLNNNLSANTTVGSLLGSKHPDLDKNDPHKSLVSALSSRTAILKEAILICLGQLENNFLV